MPSVYDVLLGNVTDQDRMAAAARRLRQREALGTLMQMTGDPVLGPLGQQELERIPQTAGRLRTAQTAVAQQEGLDRWRQQQNLLAAKRLAFEEQREARKITPLGGPFYGHQGEIKEIEDYEEYLQREHERTLEEKGAGRQAAWNTFVRQKNYEKSFMSDSAEKEFRDNKAMISQGRRYLNRAKSLAEKGGKFKEPWVDLATAGVGAVFGSGAGQYATERTKTSEEMQVLSNWAEWIANIRHKKSGAALTIYEGIKGAPWDPMEPGISQEIALQRFEDLVGAVEVGNYYLALGKRIPGVAGNPGTLPQKPIAGMTDEEWAEFLTEIQNEIDYSGGGYRTPRTPEVAPAPVQQPPTPGAAVTPPIRPDGVSDEDWQAWLEENAVQ